MVAKELGTKLTCQSCETKFYDLNKNILVGFNKYVDDSKIFSEEHLLELKKKSKILNMDIERIAKTELE